MEKDEKMRLQAIRQAGIKYKQISLWMTAAMALAILFSCRISAQCDDIIAQVVNPLIVSAIFSLVASTAYGEAWKAVPSMMLWRVFSSLMHSSGMPMVKVR